MSMASITVFLISVILLSFLAINNSLAPVVMFIFMVIFASTLIFIFSKEEILIKLNLFLFFFSLYFTYVLLQHYVFLVFDPTQLPYHFSDESKFYEFSEIAIPYLTGEKDFFWLFYDWNLPLHDLPLHTVFSGYIAYFSILIDGSNSIVIQKLLSPFFGGLIIVVLYSIIKQQFGDTKFALNATFAYGLLSSLFMYSTPLLRDIDVALAYILFFYIFLQKYSLQGLVMMSIIAFLTIYLRVESGMLLYGIILIYIYLFARSINNQSLKFIIYIIVFILIVLVSFLMYHKVTSTIANVDESYKEMGIAQSSSGSISLLFNKLPFGLSHTAKLLFSQLKPFPFLFSINKPLEAISGLLWPFIFILMLYAVIVKDIRKLMDTKIHYLLMVSIMVLYLMSSGPLVRRMMSVYPIIYLASLYVFWVLPNHKLKRVFIYYLFGIVSLNILYYYLKI